MRENQKAFSLAEESEAYKNFIDSINSDTTRYEYAKNLRYFLSFYNLPRYEDLLLIDQPKLEVQIRDYIVPHIIDLKAIKTWDASVDLSNSALHRSTPQSLNIDPSTNA